MKKLLMVILMAGTMADAGEFSAGFGRTDITPPLGTFMPGYFKARYGTGVATPLVAECVALCDGATTGLVFSVDNLHLTANDVAAVRRQVLARLGIPAELLFIASTHIHTCAATDTDYYKKGIDEPEQRRMVALYGDMVATRITDAAIAATADLAPSRMYFARSSAPGISFIRRFRMKDGSVQTNPRNEGEIDHVLGVSDDSVQLVRFRRNGAPDIALVNYQCHPDTVGGTLYHSDWPGEVRRVLEEGLGDGTHCFMLNGAQGDSNHCRRGQLREEARAFPDTHTYRRMGRVVAGAALSVWEMCREVPVGKVRGAITVTDIPSNRPTADEVKWIKLFDAGRTAEIPVGGMELATLTSRDSRARRLMNGPDSFSLPVSSIAVGTSLAFAGFPGEPFTQIGLDVKAKSPFAMTAVACLVNDSCGYLPSTRSYEEGGYEVLSSKYASPVGDKLTAVQLEQLKRLYADD